MMMKIDELDEKILQALMKDARSKLTEIAEDCGISSTAVLNRINRMRYNGLIIQEVLIPNLEFFGYHFPALIGINLEQDQEHVISKLINKNMQTVAIDQTIGKYDLCAFVMAKSIDELDKIKYSIRNLKGVENVEINIWNKTHLVNNVKLKNKE